MSKDQRTTATQTTTADPTTLGREEELWNRATELTNQPYQPYTGQLVAGFTPDQQAGFGAVRNAVNLGMPAVGQGVQFATQAGQYNPMMLDPRTAGPAAQANGAGVDALFAQYAQSAPGASARDVTARRAIDMGLQDYLNPWTDDVVNASLADQERARQAAIMQGQAQATRAGAFGGSRHGVRDALTNEAALREAGSLAANTRAAGFTTALQALTGDANRNLSAQQGNQAADVNTSIANAQTGASLLANRAGLAANLGMFNAGQTNAMNQFDASLGAQADQANQAAGLTANAQRLGAAGTLGDLGMTQQQMGLTGADALLRSGGMQQGLQQAQLDSAYDQWLRQQADPYNRLMFRQGFLGTPGQTTNSQQTTVGSTLGGLLGAAATVAGGPAGAAIANMFGPRAAGKETAWTDGIGG